MRVQDLHEGPEDSILEVLPTDIIIPFECCGQNTKDTDFDLAIGVRVGKRVSAHRSLARFPLDVIAAPGQGPQPSPRRARRPKPFYRALVCMEVIIGITTRGLRQPFSPGTRGATATSLERRPPRERHRHR